MYATLAPTAPNVGAGRRAITAELASRGFDAELVDTVALMASELLANAVLHSTGEIRVRMAVKSGCVRVEVWDTSPNQPMLRHPPANATSGRGLEIVDTLASRWGVDELPRGGKSVWFEVDC